MGATQQILAAYGASLLLPPSVAPVLDVQTELGSDEASLTWTASNRTGTAGFSYQVQMDVNGGGYSVISTTTSLFFTDARSGAAGETYTYRIIPFNDYGEGPASNAVGVVLPGESDGPVLTGPDLAIDSNYTLTWSAIAGATSYDLYYSRDDTSYTLLVNTAALEYEVTFDFPGMYHYVIAKNGGSSSSPSNRHYVSLILDTTSYYFRPGGADTYYRPGGTDTYIRP